MGADQKRMLTASTSKLGRIDLVNRLRKDESWILLPPEIRQRLYDLLPPPAEGEAARDIDIHPLRTTYKPYIEEGIRRWQTDLKEGREGKKWREEAMQAGRDRLAGKFDAWKELQREEYWGRGDENASTKEREHSQGNTEDTDIVASSDGDVVMVV